MSRLNCWICALFGALFSFIVLAASPAAVAAEEAPVLALRVTIDEINPSLWSWYSHQDSAYQVRNPWGAFWKKTCALSDVECTDKAFRRMKIGTVLIVPAPSIFVATSAGMKTPESIAVIPGAKVGALATLDATRATVSERELSEATQKITQLKSELAGAADSAFIEKLLLASVAAIFFLTTLALVFVRNKMKAKLEVYAYTKPAASTNFARDAAVKPPLHDIVHDSPKNPQGSGPRYGEKPEMAVQGTA